MEVFALPNAFAIQTPIAHWICQFVVLDLAILERWIAHGKVRRRFASLVNAPGHGGNKCPIMIMLIAGMGLVAGLDLKEGAVEYVNESEKYFHLLCR